MAHTYLLFDFGSDEEKVQQARHKLESWKQAFRLDKKLQYKLEREQAPSSEPAAKAEPSAKSEPEPAKSEKSKPTKGKSKPKAKSGNEPGETENHGPVKLLVRLYFSGHEKLSEQRWLDRIPSEEPFKSASPKVIQQSDPEFEKADQHFESLD